MYLIETTQKVSYNKTKTKENTMAENDRSEEWNMAMAYLQRIDIMLTHCAQCQYEGRFKSWYSTLQCLFKEIYPKMKEVDRTKTRSYLSKLSEVNQQWEKNKNLYKPFLNQLFEFELTLRQILEDKSMLTPKPDDPRYALMGKR